MTEPALIAQTHVDGESRNGEDCVESGSSPNFVATFGREEGF